MYKNKPVMTIIFPYYESMKNPIVTNNKAIMTVMFPIWNMIFLPYLANRQLLNIPLIKFNENRKIGIRFFDYGNTKEVMYEQ